MTESTAEPTVDAVLAELAALDDPKIRAVNERRGDAHGVHLTKLRAVAKPLGKRRPELAAALWATGGSAARLVSILMAGTHSLTADEVDARLREAATPKELDWLIAYIAAKHPEAEALRRRWLADDAPDVEAAGWSLTAERIVRSPEALDLPALLDEIEQRMAAAPGRLQWAMNTCLGNIGIEHAEHRARVLDIGERLGVLRDYPTPPNCTSPFVPLWVAEMVRRQEEASK